MNKLIKVVLCISMFLMLFGCQQETEVTRPSEEEIQQEIDEKAQEAYDAVQTEKIESFYIPSEIRYGSLDLYSNKTADEAFRRYRKFAYNDFYDSLTEGENEIVSPLSLYYALAILANAADGQTKEEMQTVLGMAVDDLNLFLSELDSFYPDNSEDPVFTKANALWLNTDLGKLKQDYVETIKTYYGNSINEGSFSEKQKIVNEVNKWSEEKTKGAINDIISEADLQDDTFLLILNALTAGGKWRIEFNPNDTFLQEFNCYDNTRKLVEMMHQTLYGYWSDGKSEGFSKALNNGSNFVAIVPNLGTDIYEYINSIDGDIFKYYMENVHYDDVVGTFMPDYTDVYPDGCPIVDQHYTNLSFPKFAYEKEYDLVMVLKKLGLKNIFENSTCDFSKMSDEPVYVQQVKQKCTVEVDEKKAVAAAVTLIENGIGGGDCIQVRDKIYHDVVFDRPFLYAFVDYNGKNTMFMGIVNNIGEPATDVMQIENITGKINIRNIPSTKGEKSGFFEKGQIVYAFETKEAEGYTWYRIGTDKWVADKNGEWIKVLKQY